MKNVLALAAIAAMVGCSSVKYIPSAGANYPALPDNCYFAILSVAPAVDAELIGLLEITSEHGKRPKTEEEFRRVISGKICSAGGEIVVGFKDGEEYSRGNVYRLKPAMVDEMKW